MHVLILGGDGYLGWPTAMALSARGHDVFVVDNYLHRDISRKNDLPYLFPVPNLEERTRLWKDRSAKEIRAHIGDVTNYDFLFDVFKEARPDAVVYYAEQPSAPYSMAGREEAALTLTNNLVGTLNVAYAVKEVNPDCHIVKLGTMGEYGTPNIDIEEGWIDIEHKGRSDRFLFPRQAGSLYHTTKIQDTDLLYFYVRMWGLRVTDLMQGPVYGIFSDEMEGDTIMASHFSYDETFGTVLNRFVVQAVAGVPLTVYGKGGQTRGYLNLKDTLQCVLLALENPVKPGELRIFNQFTETFSVNELAQKVVDAGKELGIPVQLENVENPRVEAEEHYYNPAHHGLGDLGLDPHPLTNEVLIEMMRCVQTHKDSIRSDNIMPKVKWEGA